MNPPSRTITGPVGGPGPFDPSEAAGREWLVANGLGGYASGSALGRATRRYHGLLIAALPPPSGRTMMLDRCPGRLILPDGSVAPLGLDDPATGPESHLVDFRLEAGLPVWRYEAGGLALEKRLVLEHGRNTARITYRRVGGDGPATLALRPAFRFRGHDAPPSSDRTGAYLWAEAGGRFEASAPPGGPTLRLAIPDHASTFEPGPEILPGLVYPVEAERGYDSTGSLWSPGEFRVDLQAGESATLVASAVPWERVDDRTPAEAARGEADRRLALIRSAGPKGDDPVIAELVLAADAFLIEPQGRAPTSGEPDRTVIAGYHWFTDWGRDAMIGLEGLTLCTGRFAEGRSIFRGFAGSVRDGLIPNLFPEGGQAGLYHTADATLWFFHALHRYLVASGDRPSLEELFPTLLDIVDHHLRGTRFGIGVDPADGLLRQGAEGYQLTWMDAKVDGWVVTPRRGKAVEINALWYNALRHLEAWANDLGRPDEAARLADHAGRAQISFNRRFWADDLGHLYDVVDGESGDDPACRPNQLFALALDHPALDPSRWPAVLETCRSRLLTPVGLRSLAPGHPDYKPTYQGDLRARDAAYHQGTAWSWLIGPYIDAHLKVHPGDRAGARSLLAGLIARLGEAGLGTVSEVFDAEPPHHPRGCIAQAWGVAELLRSWIKTA